MALSAALTLVGASCAFAAAVLLAVHYGGGERPLLPLVESCSARLKEIERKSREGAFSEIEADEARSRAVRALLDDLRARESRWWILRGDRSALVIVGLAAASVAALSSLGVTDSVGDLPRPGVSALDFSEDPDAARLAAYAKSVPYLTPSGSSVDRALPDVETLIARLTARLKSQPDDADGWRMLGWSHFHTQQPRKAAEAYERALALRPASADLMTAYGEALVAAEAGVLTAKATEMFNAALKIDAANAKARYFLALAKEQAGKKREALEEWLSLQGALVNEEVLTADLRQRIRALADELGLDVPLSVERAKSSAGSKAKGAQGGQRSAEDFQRIEALPPDQRQALIRGMVEGLADRLKSSPQDEEGWIKLMRSRVVLGEDSAARETLDRALAAFANDAATQSRLKASAKELGIGGK
jgi:cytochrome c-type biogenesis protein CcmH